MGEWRYSSTHWMEVNGQPHAPAVEARGNSPRYSFDRRLVGPRSRSGCCGEDKISKSLSSSSSSSSCRRRHHGHNHSQPTNAIEHNLSWEANSDSASQEIPRLLWNPKFYYRVHKSPPLMFILSQMHPVHNFPPCFPKICFNVIFPSAPVSS